MVVLAACSAASAFGINGGDLSTSGLREVNFQGLRWSANNGSSLTVDDYRGLEALAIEGRRADSYVKLEGLEFESGRIEFDLAYSGKIPPWICLGLRSDGSADRLRFNPTSEPGTARLSRAVLTKNERNSLVLNYRQLRQSFDANGWLHVELAIKDGICWITVGNDSQVTMLLENPFADGGFAIQGNCYIRNFKVES